MIVVTIDTQPVNQWTEGERDSQTFSDVFFIYMQCKKKAPLHDTYCFHGFKHLVKLKIGQSLFPIFVVFYLYVYMPH